MRQIQGDFRMLYFSAFNAFDVHDDLLKTEESPVYINRKPWITKWYRAEAT